MVVVITFVFRGVTKKAVNRSGTVLDRVSVNSAPKIFSQIFKKSIKEKDKEAVIEATNSNISLLKIFYFGSKIVFCQIIVVRNIIIILEDGRLFLEVFMIKGNLRGDKDVNI